MPTWNQPRWTQNALVHIQRAKIQMVSKPSRLLVQRWCGLRASLDFVWYRFETARWAALRHRKNHSEPVEYGPLLTEWPDGSWREIPRTRARIAGIRTLSAKYPWMGNSDHQMFLDGFDAGERYSQGIAGLGNGTHTRSESA